MPCLKECPALLAVPKPRESRITHSGCLLMPRLHKLSHMLASSRPAVQRRPVLATSWQTSIAAASSIDSQQAIPREQIPSLSLPNNRHQALPGGCPAQGSASVFKWAVAMQLILPRALGSREASQTSLASCAVPPLVAQKQKSTCRLRRTLEVWHHAARACLLRILYMCLPSLSNVFTP